MWQDILKTAIIGTERSALALPARNDALGNMLVNLNAEDREASLLSVAATVALYERAGQLPNVDHQPLPTAAETDELPCCNARAAQHLSLMLSGEFKELLPEWLTTLSIVGKHVPEECLLAVLNLGKTEQQLREVIIKAIGKRGAWLATQNPIWDYVQKDIDETAWDTGTHRIRLAILKKLFSIDPPRAKTLVITSWKELSADERSEFLSLFQNALSSGDESFLEAALSDVSKGVRRTAAKLLATLPESAYVTRNFERAKPLLSFQSPKRKKPFLEVAPPSVVDEGMARDMISSRPGQYGEGEKASMLRQLLSIVPPSLWCQHFAVTAEELLQATRKNEWRNTLLSGWGTAARNHQDIVWLKALINELMHMNGLASHELLIQSLPLIEQEEFALQLLHKPVALLSFSVLQNLLRLMPGKWSVNLSRTVLARIFSELQALQEGEESKKTKNKNRPEWPLPLFLKQLALHLPLELLDEAETTIERNLATIAPTQQWLVEFEVVLTFLRFRREALIEIIN